MFTQCPECLTVYHLTTDVLSSGRGSVTCGHCSVVFDALRTLTEALPSGRFQRLESNPLADQLPELVMPVMRPVAAEDLFAKTDYVPRASGIDALPEFVRTAPVASRVPAWPYRVGVALLMPLFLGQVAYAERQQLADNAFARPWLERACSHLGCRLPALRNSDTLALLSRDVRPHPSVPNALIISATLRNQADHVQAFPIVEITLADLDEHRIAMRRFKPQEYIDDARTIGAGLAPGASTALVFEVADPGKNAVAYEFKFL
jgi:predicted Zn finger-like uncharacterized protein